MKPQFVLIIHSLILAMLACSSVTSLATQGSQRGQLPTPQPPSVTTAETLPVETAKAVQEVTPTPRPTLAGESILAPAKGLSVAFTLEGNVSLWKNGVGYPLTYGGDAVDVSISPDGQVVVYTRQVSMNQSELWAINSDGSNHRQLLNAAALDAFAPGQVNSPYRMGWIPETHKLLFNTRFTIEGPGMPVHDDLQQVDVDTGAQTTLAAPQKGGIFHVSPDGRKILLVKADSINVIDADGNGRRELLTFPTVNTYSEWFYTPTPVWSADSTFFWVVIPPKDPLGDPTAKATLWKVKADGSGKTAFSTFLCVPIFQDKPAVSPVGDRLAYLRPADNIEGTTELHLANLDLTGDTVIKTGKNGFVGWSPDGMRFVYWVDQPVKWWVGQVNGEAIPVDHAVHPGSLRWVDPVTFLFTNSGDQAELWLIRLEGASQLIGNSAKPIAYDFSP